jgi:hypothetical protein
MVTPAQLRAARGLLNWSVSELSEKTGLAMNTVRKAEDVRAYKSVNKANSQLLRSTLEAEGVAFIDADALGVGVRLRDPQFEPSGSRRSTSKG